MLYRARFEDANVEGSKVGIVPDLTYSVHNLFEGMMLISGNDAATALATAAGGVRRTVARMNAVAREPGRPRHDGPEPERARRAAPVHLGVRPDPHHPSRHGARGLPRVRQHRALDVPGEDAAAQGKPRKTFRDLDPGQAADELPRRHRCQDRLHEQGEGDVRRRGHPRRPHPRRHRAAHQAQLVGGVGGPARLGLRQRLAGHAGRHAEPADIDGLDGRSGAGSPPGVPGRQRGGAGGRLAGRAAVVRMGGRRPRWRRLSRCARGSCCCAGVVNACLSPGLG